MLKLMLTITQVILFFIAFAQQKSLLWEVSKPGYNTSYLFGTIHLNHKQVLAEDSMVLHYIKNSDAYAGEIIFNEGDILNVSNYFFGIEEEKQCKTILSAEELSIVKVAIRDVLGPELEIFVPTFSPYIVATLLSYPLEEDGEENTMFLDMYLQEFADSMGLTLISLESVESQMAYLNNIDPQKQKAHLLKVVKQLGDTANNDMDILLEAYINGDIAKIEDLLVEYADEDPIMDNNFMEERNKIHANGLMEAMKTKKTFTAIGAAHLPGKNGVIELLKNEGFSLRILNY